MSDTEGQLREIPLTDPDDIVKATETEVKTKELPKTELDEILKEFKLTDRCHIITNLLLGFTLLTNSVYAFNFIFAAHDVNYRCQYEECNGSSLTTYLNLSAPKECMRYMSKDNATCSIDGIYLNKMEDCEQWVYEDPTSFVAEFDLGCQDWKRTFIGSIHGIGLIFGLLFSGLLSDRYGRKLLIVSFGIMGGVFGVARSITSYYWLYIFFEFMEAFVGDTMSSAFTMIVESAPPGKRIMVSRILLSIHGCGPAVNAFIAWLLPYWRHYLMAIYLPALLHIVHAFYLLDSVKWLMIKGKTEKAIKIINEMAKDKNITIDTDKLANIKVNDDTKNMSLLEVLKVTLSSNVLVTRFVVCVSWWISMVFMNFGTAINLYNMNGNIYLFYLFMSVVDIGAYNSSYYIQTMMRRKRPLIFLYYSAGTLFIVQAFIGSFGFDYISSCLFLVARFMTMNVYSIVYLYTSELFPTYTRNTMHALCSAFARIGSIMAPQTPLLITYWSGIPSLLFGFTALFAGTFTFLVPDTIEDSLPDTVEEAEKIGNIKT